MACWPRSASPPSGRPWCSARTTATSASSRSVGVGLQSPGEKWRSISLSSHGGYRQKNSKGGYRQVLRGKGGYRQKNSKGGNRQVEDRRQPPLEEEEEEGDSRQCVHRRMPPHMRVRCSDAWFVYCFLFKGRTQKKRVRNRETCGAQNIRNVKKIQRGRKQRKRIETEKAAARKRTYRTYI